MFVKRKALIVVALAFASAPLGSQTAGKESLTHEAMWLMKRVGSPALSPDGKWVVFSVTEPAYDRVFYREVADWLARWVNSPTVTKVN